MMHMRLAIERDLNMENFLAVNENPVHIRQVCEDDAPFVLPPPQAAESNGCEQQDGMITHPKDTVEIWLRRVVSNLGQFIQKTVR